MPGQHEKTQALSETSTVVQQAANPLHYSRLLAGQNLRIRLTYLLARLLGIKSPGRVAGPRLRELLKYHAHENLPIGLLLGLERCKLYLRRRLGR